MINKTEKEKLMKVFKKLIEKNIKEEEWLIVEIEKDSELDPQSTEENNEKIRKINFHIDLLRLYQNEAFINSLPIEQILAVMDETVDNLQDITEWIC